MPWHPNLGAVPSDAGTQFRLWAPRAQSVDVILEHGALHSLTKNADGTFSGRFPDVKTGDRYRYRLDGQTPFPDPASRFQPEGVHGPSEVIDSATFVWSDRGWRGLKLDELILYELHVGTFTPQGTFAGVISQLPYLQQLGVTAVELMPVADFPGDRNWGYDGVDVFAPARCYGRPDDLRRLVDAAHRLGLAVILDVVYNHLGPDGNYLGAYSPEYFSKRSQTDWGAALNFDDDGSEHVRAFFIENALHWVHEYRVDGLRLDATHAIVDHSPEHFLAELAARVRESCPEREIVLIAEDHRNLPHMLHPERAGGRVLDAVWSDGFHHQMRRLLAGDHEGYYRDFTGTTEDLAVTIRKGWFYCGQYSEYLGEFRGGDPSDLTPPQFVYCLQNHDQIGNRALGERLHHQIALAAYRAASALFLCCPATPLLFMGQEWAASTPFLYFTHHHAELGRMVTEGRRREFRHFAAFADPQQWTTIPDPQAPETFLASQLVWAEREREPHAGTLRLYQALLQLRRSEPPLRSAERCNFQIDALDDSTVLLRRTSSRGSTILVIARLKGEGRVALPPTSVAGTPWQTVLSTDEPRFTGAARPARTAMDDTAGTIWFPGPAAVILREPEALRNATRTVRG